MIKSFFGCGRGFWGEFMFGKQGVLSAHLFVLFFYSEKMYLWNVKMFLCAATRIAMRLINMTKHE
jgi:hypothetical protein